MSAASLTSVAPRQQRCGPRYVTLHGYLSVFNSPSLSSDWQCLSYGGCLEVKVPYYQNCSVLCCVRQLCTTVCTQIWAALKFMLSWGYIRFCVFLKIWFVFLCVSVLFYVTLVLCCYFCWVLFLFIIEPRDWLGRTSPKWPILCRVGRKTLVHLSVESLSLCRYKLTILRDSNSACRVYVEVLRQYVCLCLLAYLKNHVNFAKFSVHVDHGSGLVLFWRRWDTLRTSGCVDNVMFARKDQV